MMMDDGKPVPGANGSGATLDDRASGHVCKIIPFRRPGQGTMTNVRPATGDQQPKLSEIVAVLNKATGKVREQLDEPALEADALEQTVKALNQALWHLQMEAQKLLDAIKKLRGWN